MDGALTIAALAAPGSLAIMLGRPDKPARSARNDLLEMDTE